MAKEIEVIVKEIIKRSPSVKSVRLSIEGEANFKAGQFMHACLKEEPECRRYLSISNSPTEKGYLEFTKKITESKFSKILQALKIGDRLKIEYPFGNFTLMDSDKKIAFLSGGIGITPIRSICKYAVDKKLDLDVALIYANRSIKDIIFKQDFDVMQKQYPKLRVAHVLCEPEPGFKCSLGLINAQVIKNEIPDFSQRRFYLCGPPEMVEAMKKVLREELNLPNDSIITENFTGY